MAGNSTIEWTDSTWNPIAGCSVVSPGCTNCYAMRSAARLAANPQTPHYHGTVQSSKAGPVWTGKIGIASEHILTAPLRWRNPRRIFVNSMGDLFHESIPDKWIDKVFAVMASAPRHTFQVLTKRAERMRTYFAKLNADDGLTEADSRVYAAGCNLCLDINRDFPWPLPNVWLGVSCERQQEADERIPHLLQTPAAIRFVSAEPLLGPIDLTAIEAPDKVEGERWTFSALETGDYYEQWSETMLGEPRRSGGDGPYREHKLDWIIVGGESGPGARPMHPDWARSIQDQCAAAVVAFFFKQRGAYTWIDDADYDASRIPELPSDWRERTDGEHICMRADGSMASGYGGDSAEFLYRVGKKRAGRLLDGKEHNGFPVIEGRESQHGLSSPDSKTAEATSA